MREEETVKEINEMNTSPVEEGENARRDEKGGKAIHLGEEANNSGK